MHPATDSGRRDSKAGGELVVEVERIFEAPRSLVFEMWVKGRNMARWAAPDGFDIPIGEENARLGGPWHTSIRSPGGAELRVSGSYREILPPSRLVLDHQCGGGAETRASVGFEDLGDGRTRMRLHQSGFDSVADRDRYATGWEQSIGRLGSYLEDYLESDAKLAPANDPAPLVLTIERLFDAPRELVFKLWSKPEHIVRWWGPKGYHLGHCEMDFREGGAWRFAMEPQPGHQHWIHGVYKEIRSPERLSFTYINEADGHDMLVTLDFIEQSGKTLMKFRQAEFMTVLERNAHGIGWSETFEIFTRFLKLLQSGELSGSSWGWRQGEGVEADLRAAAERHRTASARPAAGQPRPDRDV